MFTLWCRAELEKLQEASAAAVVRLEAATEQEAEAAAALEEADKKLRALKADRDKTKDFEELEAQHVQVENTRSPLHARRTIRLSCHIASSSRAQARGPQALLDSRAISMSVMHVTPSHSGRPPASPGGNH